MKLSNELKAAPIEQAKGVDHPLKHRKYRSLDAEPPLPALPSPPVPAKPML
jgi:hypothetical protein